MDLPPAISSYYEAEQRERPSKNRWDRIKLALEFLAFGAALLLAVFAYRTLLQVKRQADGAQVQIDIMRKQLELTQGAILTVGTLQVSGHRKQLKIPIANEGSLPVRGLTVKVEYFVVEGRRKVFTRSNIRNDPKSAILPRQSPFSLVIDLPEVPAVLAGRITSGEVTASVFGSVEYSNGFGTEETAPFCAVYKPNIPTWVDDQCGSAIFIDLNEGEKKK